MVDHGCVIRTPGALDGYPDIDLTCLTDDDASAELLA